VNKAELIDKVAVRLEVSRKQAADAVDEVISSITAAVSEGERVAITGFGVFEKVERKARTGRNPATGAIVKIKAMNVPKFRAGAEFKTVVSTGKASAAKRVSAAKKATNKATAPAKKATKKATAPAKTAVAKQTAAVKAAAKKTAAKKAPAKKAPVKKAPAKKAPVKKAPAKKAPAKKAPAKKAPAKKAPS
jgi:DNA-binding protein HU-beta